MLNCRIVADSSADLLTLSRVDFAAVPLKVTAADHTWVDDEDVNVDHMLETLRKQNPSSIDVCTLLLKPGKLEVQLDIRYCCMEIPNDFIVGYGLDYDGFGRNTRDIYTLV